MDLCLAEKRRLRPRVATIRWEHECLDYKGIWAAAWTEEQIEGEEDMEEMQGETDE